MVASESLDHCDVVYPQVRYCMSPYWNRNNLDYLQIEIFNVNSQINRDIVVPNVCGIFKYNLYQLTHQHFVRVSIDRL